MLEVTHLTLKTQYLVTPSGVGKAAKRGRAGRGSGDEPRPRSGRVAQAQPSFQLGQPGAGALNLDVGPLEAL